MDRFNAQQIKTSEVVERLKEDLTDFNNDGLLTSAHIRSKTNFSNLLRAVNHADRIACRNQHLEKLVVVYVPAGVTNVPFSRNNYYSGQIVEELYDNDDVSEEDEQYFLSQYNWLYVTQINDRYVYIHKKYPVGNEVSDERLQKVNANTFFGNPDVTERRYGQAYSNQLLDYKRSLMEHQCLFMPDENRLILGRSFTEPRFLRFKARLQPGLLNIKDIPSQKCKDQEYDVYKVLAPVGAMEYLLQLALYHLLPRSAAAARQLVQVDLLREENHYLKGKPGDHNVVVPHFSF